MMENYDRTLELVEVAQNSAGKSSEQFAKYQDTVEYKINQIKNAWEQLRISFMGSDFLKNALDLFRNFIDTVKDMNPSQFAAVGVIGLTIGKQVIMQMISGIKDGGDSLAAAFNAVLKKATSGIGSAISGIRSKITSKTQEKNMIAAMQEKMRSYNVSSQSITAETSRWLLQYGQIESKLTDLNLKTKELLKNDQGIERAVTDLNAEETRKLNTLKSQSEELKRQKQILTGNLNQKGISKSKATNLARGMGSNPTGSQTGETNKVLSGIGSGLQQGVTSAITTALITGISGADLGTVLKTALVSGLMSAIPSVLAAVIPAIATFLLGPAGIVVAVAAVVVGIVAAISIYAKKQQELRDAELERLANVKKANEELQKQTDELINSYKKAAGEEEKFNDAIKTVKDTQNKSFLTSDEQSVLDSAVEYLNSNYEGAIEEIENSNRFKVIEEKVIEIEENTRDDKQKQIAEVYQNWGKQINNLGDRRTKSEEIVTSISETPLVVPANGNYSSSSGVLADNSKVPSEVKELYGDIEFEYMTVDESIGLLVEGLRDLGTLYGDSLSFDEVFGVEGLDDMLYEDVAQEELGKIFTENGKDTVDILTSIQDTLNGKGETILSPLSTAIEELNSTEESAANKEGIKDSLLLQGWSEDAAKIASYTTGAERSKVEAIDAKEKGPKQFLEDIKGGNFKSAFGEQYAESAKTVFDELGYGGEDDKLKLEDFFSSGTNVEKFSELSQEWQDALNASTDADIKEYVKNWKEKGINKDDRKEADKMQEVILQVLSERLVSTGELFTADDQKFFETYKTQFENLGSKVSDASNQTWAEYEKDIDDIINSTNNKEAENSMRAYLKNSEDSVYQQWQGYMDGLKEIGLNEDILSKMDFASTSTLSGEISDMNLTGYATEQLMNYINESFSGLDSDALNVLGQIDLSDIASLSLEASQDYIDQLTEATGDAEEATSLYNDYIKKVQAITRSGAFLGTDSTTVLKSNFQEYFSAYEDTYDSMQTATEEMFENQSLSAETYYQLIEDGFEDYVTVTSRGYALIGDKAEEMWTNMALKPVTKLDNKIAQQEELLKESDTMLSDFKQKEGYSDDTLDDLIEQYHALSEEERESSNLLAAFTDKEKDFIDFIVSNGCTSIEDYNQALIEGKMALEGMRADTWIESLSAMSSMAQQAAESVEELKDDLKEAKKDQEENTKSLNDAVDALREAKEGTDNYRSGLDSLINYTNKIDRLNDAIETTKERLEDVGSVDEASGLLSQLGSSYGSKKAALGAENMALDQGMADLRNVLTQKYRDYVSFDENGAISIDFSYEESLKDNDAIKKNLEESVSKYSEYYSKVNDNLQEEADLDKELLELREQYLEDFVSVQENLISVLKENAKEEVDVQKNKYDQLEEVDNNYLDALEEAIDKQRKLRDQENQYEDLAQKEKKLSLMQRDTSGTNQKEVNKLTEEVEGDRQDLLDNEVDNIIDSLKEMYEVQKEARDAELEYMESVTENTQYFAEWASEIMSTWNSVEDMQNWYLQNDSSTEDMTVEQTESYLNTISDDFAKLATYRAEQTSDYLEKAQTSTEAMNQIFETTNTNIADVGTAMLAVAENTKNEAIEKAQETWDNAKEKFDETAKEIEQLELDLKDAENSALISHQATMEAMVEASTSGMLDVSTYAIAQLAKIEGIDWTDEEAVKTWATEKGYINSKNIGNAAFNNAYEQETGEESPYLSKGYTVNWGGGGSLNNSHSFGTEEEANSFKAKLDAANKGTYGWNSTVKPFAFAEGGLVNYTGPAWVDGTKSRPESFLSAEDTERIGTAAKLLSDIPALQSSNYGNQISSNVGETNVEIHLNIDGISSDYDVDQMMNRIKQSLTDTISPIGSSVILNK